VSSGGFDNAGTLARHGSLGDGSTDNLPVGSNCDCRSSEDIANQDTVGPHSQGLAQNPKNVIRPGVSLKYDFATGARREGGADSEDKLSVRVSSSIKSDGRIFQCYVYSRAMAVHSWGERLAPHFGKHGLSNRHRSSLPPGIQSIFSAVLSRRIGEDIAG
jgi:hypothetical protein